MSNGLLTKLEELTSLHHLELVNAFGIPTNMDFQQGTYNGPSLLFHPGRMLNLSNFREISFEETLPYCAFFAEYLTFPRLERLCMTSPFHWRVLFLRNWKIIILFYLTGYPRRSLLVTLLSRRRCGVGEYDKLDFGFSFWDVILPH